MQTRTLSVPSMSVRVRPVTWPAETLALGVILVSAAFMRLVRLGSTSGDLDEGIRGIQLLLMSAGYRPVQEIYSSQGPLLLDMLFPLYRLFGETLGAARLAVGLYDSKARALLPLDGAGGATDAPLTTIRVRR